MSYRVDPERWRRYLDGTLNEIEEQALAEELETHAAEWEAFFATAHKTGEADALDGLVDDALLGVSRVETPAALDEVGFRRLKRRMRGPMSPTGPRAAVGMLLAACVAGAVWLGRDVAPVEQYRLKGGDQPTVSALRMEVLRARTDGSIEPVASGGSVGLGEHLLLRFELPQAGCVQLWRVNGGKERLLDTPLCFDAGVHQVERQGQVLGLPVTATGAFSLQAVVVTPGTRLELIERELETNKRPANGDIVSLEAHGRP